MRWTAGHCGVQSLVPPGLSEGQAGVHTSSEGEDLLARTAVGAAAVHLLVTAYTWVEDVAETVVVGSVGTGEELDLDAHTAALGSECSRRPGGIVAPTATAGWPINSH